jgi:UDP-glucose 4-epimerase
MKILVTGSAGHLGEALMRSLEDTSHEATGLDIKSSPFTRREGSIADRGFVKRCMQGVDVVLHAATLHKPHIATHARQANGADDRLRSIHHQRNHAVQSR